LSSLLKKNRETNNKFTKPTTSYTWFNFQSL